MRSSEFCATCHTLFTSTHDSDGKERGRLAEQVPFLEWKHSVYPATNGCQSCHTPVVAEPIATASVLGQPRERLARHDFRGGNFFMLGMLNRYRAELGVTALPEEMDTSVLRPQCASRPAKSWFHKAARVTLQVTNRLGVTARASELACLLSQSGMLWLPRRAPRRCTPGSIPYNSVRPTGVLNTADTSRA